MSQVYDTPCISAILLPRYTVPYILFECLISVTFMRILGIWFQLMVARIKEFRNRPYGTKNEVPHLVDVKGSL